MGTSPPPHAPALAGGQHHGQHPVATLHADASPGVNDQGSSPRSKWWELFTVSLKRYARPPGTPEGEGFGKGSFQPVGQEVPGIQNQKLGS